MTKRYIAILTGAFMLNGCAGSFLSGFSGVDHLTVDEMRAPKPANLGGPDPEAPEAYKKGWNDGCKTGMGSMASGAYKSLYKYTVDQQYYNDSMYYNVWKDAYIYCRQRNFKWSWDPLDKTDYNPGNLCLICPE